MLSILDKIEALFADNREPIEENPDITEFYERFHNGIREVKAAIDGEIQLKDARTWLAELEG
jgi:hypothetical protein